LGEGEIMNLDINTVFPADPSSYEGLQFVRIVAALLLLVMVMRSCVHLFASDGGAHRIVWGMRFLLSVLSSNL
jgi:hypothetical protein